MFNSRHRQFAILLLEGALLWGGNAAAATTYDFWNLAATNGLLGEPFHMEVDGLGVDITAAGGNLNHDRLWGLGVEGGNAGTLMGQAESITFDFGTRRVALVGSVLFERKGNAGVNFRIYGDDTALGDFIVTAPGSGLQQLVDFDFSVYGWQAKRLTFEALNGDDRGMRVRGLVVDPLGTAAVGAVPLPPAVWLFGSALGLVGLLARRRSP